MGSVYLFRNALRPIAEHGSTHAELQHVVSPRVDKTWRQINRETGPAEPQVVPDKILRRNTFIADRQSQSQPVYFGSGMRHADFHHVLILNGVELGQTLGGRRRAVRCPSMTGVKVVIATLGHDIVAIAVPDRLVAEILEGLPLHDRAPGSLARLHRIIGRLDRHWPAIRGNHVIHLAVFARGDEQTKTDLQIIRTCL